MKNTKTNIILDLDNTLISAESVDTFPFKDKATKKKMSKFAVHRVENYYVVFERPNVQKFLDFLFENFNVSVWTAASKDYALNIIRDVILTKPSRKINYMFYSYHCNISKKKYGCIKDLRMYWEEFKLDGFNKNNTCIIDDHPDVYAAQPRLVYNIAEFNFFDDNSEDDSHLKTAQKWIAKEWM